MHLTATSAKHVRRFNALVASRVVVRPCQADGAKWTALRGFVG